MNTTPEITIPGDYWDGESTFFHVDANTGEVHILRESGSPTAIAERMWNEAKARLEEEGA